MRTMVSFEYGTVSSSVSSYYSYETLSSSAEESDFEVEASRLSCSQSKASVAEERQDNTVNNPVEDEWPAKWCNSQNSLISEITIEDFDATFFGSAENRTLPSDIEELKYLVAKSSCFSESDIFPFLERITTMADNHRVFPEARWGGRRIASPKTHAPIPPSRSISNVPTSMNNTRASPTRDAPIEVSPSLIVRNITKDSVVDVHIPRTPSSEKKQLKDECIESNEEANSSNLTKRLSSLTKSRPITSFQKRRSMAKAQQDENPKTQIEKKTEQRKNNTYRPTQRRIPRKKSRPISVSCNFAGQLMETFDDDSLSIPPSHPSALPMRSRITLRSNKTFIRSSQSASQKRA